MGGGDEGSGGVGGGRVDVVRGVQDCGQVNGDVIGQACRGGGSARFPKQGETSLSKIAGRFRFQHKPFSIAI